MASGLRSVVVLCFVCSFLSVESRSALDNGEAPGPPGCYPACPPGWTQFGSRCFIFYHAPRSWSDAEHFCISIGGNLASIHSAEESIFLSNLIERVTGSLKRAWLGGFDAVEEKRWMWSDGSRFNYFRWRAGQPDNYGGKEHCVDINFGGKFWNDSKCYTSFPFICSRNI